jgi:hypothetical protein
MLRLEVACDTPSRRCVRVRAQRKRMRSAVAAATARPPLGKRAKRARSEA